MRHYEVTIPIAGHACLEVEAENEEEAIEQAIDKVTDKDIESWEPLKQINRGNICYFPQPWEAEATTAGEVDGP